MAVERQGTARDDTMQMHVVQQLLIPGGQPGREAVLPTQPVLRIAGKRVQRVSDALKRNSPQSRKSCQSPSIPRI